MSGVTSRWSMVLTFRKKYGVARFKCFDLQQTGKNVETSDKFGKYIGVISTIHKEYDT